MAGQGPFYCWWTKDGVPIEDGAHYGGAHSTNLLVRGLALEDAGAYQVVVSNGFGMTTSLVTRLVIHCVDAAGPTPVAPYTNWATAATTIQAAVDAAAAGEVIQVTNGVYASGGKVEAGDLTNRVALDKAVAVLSMSGPQVTVIQGQWDPVSTNGPGAVRCAWLTNGAALSGFTLRGGATRSTGDVSGGGVWCSSPNAVVADCVLTSNSAYSYGGGCYVGTLNNCVLTGNRAFYYGGGSAYSTLKNCTLTSNSARFGGGLYNGTLKNCIVWGNAATSALSTSNWFCDVFGVLNYSCMVPLVSGTGNISVDPQLVDGVHLAVTSPCRGAGSSNYVSGTDIDGEAWATPPSMGCDEVWETGLTGSLDVAIQALQTEVVVNRGLALTGQVSGRASRLEWGFGDGPTVTNAGWLVSHAWTNTGDYTVTLTAYNTDNPAGVTTNVQVQVVPLVLPQVGISGTGSSAFQLSFGSQAGVNYIVEYTTNLSPSAVWQTLKTLTSTGGVITVQDTNFTNGACFYRVRMP